MVNRVIRLLILSDFVLYFAFGLLAPIFAVFVLKTIPGSSLQVIGLSTACYWISRTLSAIPISRFMDKTDGERDEFYFMIFGTFAISSIPLFYLVIDQPWHLYVIQLCYGLVGSMATPAWRILFTDHIDTGKTGFEWSLEDVGIGVATAASAYIGSLIADKFGFNVVLIMVSIMGYIGTIALIPIYHDAKTLEQIKGEGKLGNLRKRRKTILPFKSQ